MLKEKNQEVEEAEAVEGAEEAVISCRIPW